MRQPPILDIGRPGVAIAGHGADGIARQIELSHSVVALPGLISGIGNQQRGVAQRRQRDNVVERGFQCGHAIVEPSLARARDSGDNARGIDAPNPAILRVIRASAAEIDIARAVNRNALRRVEHGACCRPAIAREPRFARARDSGDDARCRIDPPNAMVVRIRDVEVAPRI